MLKIIQDIKYLKTLVEYSLKPEPEIKIQIEHCLENLIDLDQIMHDHDECLSHHKSILEKDIKNLIDSDHENVHTL